MLLWPFNKYPGTDYETFNWEWILKTVKEWVAKMQTFLDTITAGWNDMQQDWNDFTDHVYKEEIEEILAAHPEWTTTVMDGAITFQKLNGSIQAFTTPEAFGAVGDGVTDDTQAWQDAVDVGVTVIALHDIYKTGTIEVTKNIEIDCSTAEFICSEQTLFDCHGTVDSTVMPAPDYVASKDYSLLNDDYTGFAMIKSGENIITNRTYYYGGFPCTFENGVCHAKYPVSFGSVAVEKITPITCHIHNIGTVTHPNNVNSNRTVYCKHGYMCTFDHFAQWDDKYSMLLLEECLKCDISYFEGFITYSGNVGHYYPIELAGSGECYTHDCDMTADSWHSWTTGGNYLCFNNIVERCRFKVAAGGTSLSDHDNAIGTTVRDCDLDGLTLFGNSVAENVRLHTHRPRAGTATIGNTLNFYPTNLPNCNNFTAKDIHFVVNPDEVPTATLYYGIILGFTAQTSDNDYIINNVTLINIETDVINSNFTVPDLTTVSQYVRSVQIIGKWLFDNVIGRFKYNVVNVDWTNGEIIIKNCQRKGHEGYRISTDGSAARPMRITVYDSVIGSSNAVYDHLELYNVQHFTEGSQFTFSGTLLRADNISRLNSTTFTAFDDLMVTNMKYSDVYLWPYIVHNATVSCYGRVEATGIVNHTI